VKGDEDSVTIPRRKLFLVGAQCAGCAATGGVLLAQTPPFCRRRRRIRAQERTSSTPRLLRVRCLDDGSCVLDFDSMSVIVAQQRTRSAVALVRSPHPDTSPRQGRAAQMNGNINVMFDVPLRE
jgi:hypothetical protein